MSYRSYVKVGRRAEHAGRFTKNINPNESVDGGLNRPPIMTDDLNPPKDYPDQGPLENGDFWVDTNGGLHIYKNRQWNKIRVYTDSVLPDTDAPLGSQKEVGQTILGIETPTGEMYLSQKEFNAWTYDTIIELEEEIDTLAPTVERGKWTFNVAGTVANKGQFALYDGTVGNGNPTKVLQDAQSIWLNQLDIDGTVHGFASVRPGDLIEIFVEGSPEYGLYSVYGAPQDNTSGPSSYWAFGLKLIRTLSDNAELSNGSVCRFKIFNPPSGGEASEYILKGGDKVEGELWWGPYKPAADGNPAQNSFSGINVYARAGGTKHLLYVSTGGTYSPEELSTDVDPTVGKSITNKKYVDAQVTAVQKSLSEPLTEAVKSLKDLQARNDLQNVQIKDLTARLAALENP
jgi:hypothetical protein